MAQKKAVKSTRRVPIQARAQVTVGIILEAAARILRDGSLDELTTNHVAAVAGVGIATLYGYFRNKDEIVVALARSVLSADRAALLASLVVAPGDDPVRACVHALIVRHMTDRTLRRTVMAVHHGRGFGQEHVDQVSDVLAAITKRLFPGNRTDDDDVRFFVATRAVLGVCRALTDAESAGQPDVACIENELIRLVENVVFRSD